MRPTRPGQKKAPASQNAINTVSLELLRKKAQRNSK